MARRYVHFSARDLEETVLRSKAKASGIGVNDYLAAILMGLSQDRPKPAKPAAKDLYSMSEPRKQQKSR